MASGIGLQVFMTGRGTPYNLAAVPVIKVCSRNDLKEQWPDIIDISAGDVATGEKTIAAETEPGHLQVDTVALCVHYAGQIPTRDFTGRLHNEHSPCHKGKSAFNDSPVHIPQGPGEGCHLY